MEIHHLDNRRENIAPLDKGWSCVTHDAHRKLVFSTLAHDTLGIIPLAAGVETTLRRSAKNSVWELIDYTTYFFEVFVFKMVYFIVKIGQDTEYSVQGPATNNFLLKA